MIICFILIKKEVAKRSLFRSSMGAFPPAFFEEERTFFGLPGYMSKRSYKRTLAIKSQSLYTVGTCSYTYN